MNFSYPIARPPSSQPAEWRMKFAPHSRADIMLTALSVMA